jgi:rhodanese-related sulfurtransferase
MNFISPTDVAANQDQYFIIDIREQYEYDFANLGNKHIPMDQVCGRLAEFPADKEIVLMCKSGKRAEALGNLLCVDFNLSSINILDGGIEAWKEVVAPHLILE